MNNSTLVAAVILTVPLILAGCTPDHVGSPDGLTPFGATVWSPDGKYYAREIEPANTGQFGVFDRHTDAEVWTWNALPYIHWENYLKGLAWSPDSTRLAVMYHGGAAAGSGVYVFELFRDDMAACAEVLGYYHSIRYAANGSGVLLGDGPVPGPVLVPLTETVPEDTTEKQGYFPRSTAGLQLPEALPTPNKADPPHPADLDDNFRIVLGEAIAYLAGWQEGNNPIGYAIRGAYLWQHGERYTYDSGEAPPLCWVPQVLQEGEAEGEDENEGEGEISPWFTFQEGSGANLPWTIYPDDHYGWDVGAHPWGGAHGGFSSNTDTLASDLEQYRSNCMGVARVFIFCDFRTGLMTAPPSGSFAFDPYVYDDMDTLVASMPQQVKLIPVLLDFTLVDGVSMENTSPVGEHPDYITTYKAGFIQLLADFVSRYSNSPAIFAWEIMNEPEEAIKLAYESGGQNAGDTLRDALHLFFTELVAALHSVTEQPITLGSKHRGVVGDWKDLGLDMYQFHYYDTMAETFPLEYPAASLGLDKPVFVGELQPTNIFSKLAVLEANGYAGALFWSFNKDYDDELKSELPTYRSYFGCEIQSETEEPL